jgi:hypothetical protein
LRTNLILSNQVQMELDAAHRARAAAESNAETASGASVLLDAPTALAACCGFDLCHKYILYLYLYLYLLPVLSFASPVYLIVMSGSSD